MGSFSRMFARGTKSPVPFHVAKRCLGQLPPFDYQPPKYEGPSKQEVLKKRKQYLNPAMFLLYKEPIMVTHAKMQYMFDETGRRYLDLFGGITTISAGHCHPEVVKATKEQLDKVTHTTTIYLNNQIAEYAEELAAKFPDPLKVVCFVNSGSEANDLALLMARLYTKNFDFICLRNGYHGLSDTMMGVTGLSTWKATVPQGFGVHHAMNPDPYRGHFAGHPEMASKYAAQVKDIIQYGTSGRAAGGVCIADEVQTGFGRLGTNYWGFQEQGLKPDIVTTAKSIGNGFPLAAVITTPEIASTLTARTHFNTFGGNPVSCAVGRAVLRAIDNDNLQQNCHERGTQFLKGLNKLKDKYDLIGDVRGKGLMLGVEFVKDRKTKEPASQEYLKIFEHAKENGVLLGKGGFYGNVMRLKPPMCISAADVDYTIDVLDDALAKL